ncbi:hypothetical protein RhiirA4_486039, partial [Rhizophagus irregularis]
MNTSESYSNIENISTSESYPGQNILISYIIKNKKTSYWGFLISYRDIISTLVFSDSWDELDHIWTAHFLYEGKDIPGLKNKVNSEHLRYAKILQIYWKEIINKYKKEKENLVPTAKKIIEIPHSIPADNYFISNNNDYSIPAKDNIEAKNHTVPAKDYSIANNNYTNEIYCLGEELESAFNKIWTEKLIFHVKQKEKLKRIQDTNDAYLSSELVTKQIRILEQNKDKLVYRQVVNDALLIASAYENLVA